jgi:hypothetical protein
MGLQVMICRIHPVANVEHHFCIAISPANRSIARPVRGAADGDDDDGDDIDGAQSSVLDAFVSVVAVVRRHGDDGQRARGRTALARIESPRGGSRGGRRWGVGDGGDDARRCREGWCECGHER